MTRLFAQAGAAPLREDLPRETLKKLDLGYPPDNGLFQTPRRALLLQNDTLAFDASLAYCSDITRRSAGRCIPPLRNSNLRIRRSYV